MRSGWRNSIKNDLKKGQDGVGTPGKRKMRLVMQAAKEARTSRGSPDAFRPRSGYGTESLGVKIGAAELVNLHGQLDAYVLLGSHLQASSMRASRLNK
jgi:hypothetical protein